MPGVVVANVLALMGTDHFTKGLASRMVDGSTTAAKHHIVVAWQADILEWPVGRSVLLLCHLVVDVVVFCVGVSVIIVVLVVFEIMSKNESLNLWYSSSLAAQAE